MNHINLIKNGKVISYHFYGTNFLLFLLLFYVFFFVLFSVFAHRGRYGSMND